MKKYSFLYIMSFLLLFAGCKQDEVGRIAPEGDFAVNFTVPDGVITAPAKVVLTNRSKYSEKYLWKFPKGLALTKAGLTNRTTSESLVPDTIYYSLPGEYKVTLLAWQGGKLDSVTKVLNVVKMRPQIVVPGNIGVMRDVQFSAKLFQYPGQAVTYTWDFGESGLTSSEASPKVTFKQEGIHTVKLTINDGTETLNTTVEVLVMGELVKSLYFTDAVTKKIYRYPFKQLQTPVITSLSTALGLHPLAMTVYNNRIFISETGLGLRFSTGDAAKADGKIYSVDLTGGNPITVTAPFDESASGYQLDPWVHTIDGSGNIWWTTRNNSVRVAAAAGVDVAYPGTRIQLTAANAGVSSVATYFDGGVQVVNDEVWVSKTSTTGRGIWKFTTAGAFKSKLSATLDNYAIRNFIVDKVNSKIYFVVNVPSTGTPAVAQGLYKCNIDGTNIQLVEAMPTVTSGSGFSNEGGDNEFVYITGLALDTDPDDKTSGYLYYGYRDNTDINGNGPTISGNGNNSGIKRYPLDGSKAPSFLIKGYVPYGIAIDNTRR
ncbi:MAG: PKD domain-containing protein [Candidatus Pedobacter colombiensis]|uniref:PKD domain-containing protein n=1 Tax=Candidatus Pedobacter colombiensis TaxID=3121371 RepID=A0AAJ6B8U8_9SPHI|nr:PKD domain-containing protein [Pedobacter sp.]WEK19518.1 MAG: PKD domain-containing protein [Pedobacter sp.]